MTAFGDALALASMYAEMTGCDIETALKDMDFRAKLANCCPAPTPAPSAAEPAAPVFDSRRFMQALRDAAPGAEYSPGDLCAELGIPMPRVGSKRPTYLMRAAGWVFAGYRSLTTNRGQVYRKPHPDEQLT